MKLNKINAWVFVWGFLVYLLLTRFQYHFFYIEQNQLFLNVNSYGIAKLAQVGGLSGLLSEFLVQFFIYPYAGPLIVATLLTGVGMATQGVLRLVAPKSPFFIAPILPMLALLFVHFDFYYRIQGTISYLMMLLFMYGYMNISRPSYRLIAGALLAPLLFGIGGSVALLFVLLVALYEILKKTSQWYLAWIGLAEVCLLGILSTHAGWLGEYRFSLTPELYYHHKLHPQGVIYFAWIILPILFLIVTCWKKNEKEEKSKLEFVLIILQVTLVLFLLNRGIAIYGDSKNAKLKELDYYSRTEQWDKTIQACQGNLTNYLYVCHLNMALANRGELADKMFHYNQMGVEGLIVPWNKQEHVSCLLSDVYFTMGAIASSQEMAFEAYVSAMGDGNPRMLKRLVQTNLIFGDYPVAEKYISTLEKTSGYEEWATSQRQYLYNDEAIKNDSILGTRRVMLPKKNTLTVLEELTDELDHLLENGSGNKATLQYLGAIYLLTKNLDGFKALVEKYYGTKVLPILPVHFQEAIIVMSEKNAEYWKRFNLSDAIVSRFEEYKKQVLANRNHSGVAGLLNRAYGNTYWFYYMFK
ncbi:MAG: hypothetical protein IJ430_03070 [Parabacteroides sp.]|nr:hypothetical protein [Parabacteroides sp.]